MSHLLMQTLSAITPYKWLMVVLCLLVASFYAIEIRKKIQDVWARAWASFKESWKQGEYMDGSMIALLATLSSLVLISPILIHLLIGWEQVHSA